MLGLSTTILVLKTNYCVVHSWFGLLCDQSIFVNIECKGLNVLACQSDLLWQHEGHQHRNPIIHDFTFFRYFTTNDLVGCKDNHLLF